MDFVDLTEGCVMCKLIDSKCWTSFINVPGTIRCRYMVHLERCDVAWIRPPLCLYSAFTGVGDTDQSHAPFFGSGGPWCEDKSSRKTT